MVRSIDLLVTASLLLGALGLAGCAAPEFDPNAAAGGAGEALSADQIARLLQECVAGAEREVEDLLTQIKTLQDLSQMADPAMSVAVVLARVEATVSDPAGSVQQLTVDAPCDVPAYLPGAPDLPIPPCGPGSFNASCQLLEEARQAVEEQVAAVEQALEELGLGPTWQYVKDALYGLQRAVHTLLLVLEHLIGGPLDIVEQAIDEILTTAPPTDQDIEALVADTKQGVAYLVANGPCGSPAAGHSCNALADLVAKAEYEAARALARVRETVDSVPLPDNETQNILAGLEHALLEVQAALLAFAAAALDEALAYAHDLKVFLQETVAQLESDVQGAVTSLTDTAWQGIHDLHQTLASCSPRPPAAVAYACATAGAAAEAFEAILRDHLAALEQAIEDLPPTPTGGLLDPVSAAVQDVAAAAKQRVDDLAHDLRDLLDNFIAAIEEFVQAVTESL